MKPTRIEKIETILWQRWLIVRVHCEDGTVGVGEGGVHGWQRPTETMVKTFAPYLVGQDPSRIEHHYQYLYRSSHFMGSVVQGALSAIDIALWDIKGKRLGVPIYELMGGLTRNKVRCYMHVNGDTAEDLAADAVEQVKAGFSAVRFAAFGANFWLHRTYSEWADDAVERVGAVREAVGPAIDICVEIHRQMNPSESIALGRRLEQFNPYFYEDPMLPDSPDVMGEVQRRGNLPIATGERFTSIYEFQQLARGEGVRVRPSRPVPVRRTVRLQEGVGNGRGAAREGDTAQPAEPDKHRRVRAVGRLHSQLRVAGIHGGVGAAQERPAREAHQAGRRVPRRAGRPGPGRRTKRKRAHRASVHRQDPRHATPRRRLGGRQVAAPQTPALL